MEEQFPDEFGIRTVRLKDTVDFNRSRSCSDDRFLLAWHTGIIRVPVEISKQMQGDYLYLITYST